MDTVKQIAGDILMFIFFLPMLSTPFVWVYVGLHELICLRVNDCRKRKCTYWNYCRHSKKARKEEVLIELERIIQELRDQLDDSDKDQLEDGDIS